MKNLFKGLLAILMALALTLSVVESEITEISEFLIEYDTEITEQKDDGGKTNCSINCDESWLDVDDNEY